MTNNYFHMNTKEEKAYESFKNHSRKSPGPHTITVCFNQIGIGVGIRVKCSCGREKNITDYGSW